MKMRKFSESFKKRENRVADLLVQAVLNRQWILIAVAAGIDHET